MAESLRFEDGAAYERFMGGWSQSAGAPFLDWLAPAMGWTWVDVGCGTGAFSALVLDRVAPVAVHGIDRSPAPLAFARTRLAGRPVHLARGDARALPLATAGADAAVMPLVLAFVPDPARAVAELARVVRPGGTVAAYMWDLEGGGFPYEVLHALLRARHVPVPWPPVPAASRLEGMAALWRAAGLRDVAVTTMRVSRRFASVEAFWETARGGPGGEVRQLEAGLGQELREALREQLGRGEIVVEGWANAVKGVVGDAG